MKREGGFLFIIAELTNWKLHAQRNTHLNFFICYGIPVAPTVGGGTNNIGALLSTIRPTQYHYEPVSLWTPQLNIDTLVYSQTEWLYISFEFIADSVYSYLTIGNFYPDSLTQHVDFNPNCFSPACGAYYYIDDIKVYSKYDPSIGINEKSGAFINLYPNPTQEEINISSEMNICAYSICDFSGRVLMQQTLTNEKKFKADISALAQGIYLLKLETERGSVVKKIIKEN